jgi:tight adherence protein C
MLDLIAENVIVRLLFLGFLFAVVAAGAYFAAQQIAARQMTRRRLLEESPRVTGGNPAMGSLRTERVESAWLKLVNSVEKSGLSLVDSKDEALRHKLAAAGFNAPFAPRVYTLVRLVLVVGLPILVFLLFWMSGSTPSLIKLYLALVVAAALGLYLPNIFVRAKADRRQRDLINGFPDALDLMLVCVEAGLGLEAAFSRVGMEMTGSHPRLAEQFGAVVLELRAGRSHEDALRRMADRAGVDEIRAFSTLLIQSTKLGSSIAQTLRTYAGEMREKRRMRAEEKAHRLPVLISIPLVGCMLPTMIGVLMLPAAIRVVRAVLPALAGPEGGGDERGDQGFTGCSGARRGQLRIGSAGRGSPPDRGPGLKASARRRPARRRQGPACDRQCRARTRRLPDGRPALSRQCRGLCRNGGLLRGDPTLRPRGIEIRGRAGARPT